VGRGAIKVTSVMIFFKSSIPFYSSSSKGLIFLITALSIVWLL
jgi:hypothetical protein